MNIETHERLVEIQEEMLELLEEAKNILRREDGIVYDRAKAYWLAHVEMGLTNSHSYMGSSTVSMEDTINECRPEEESEDDEEEEDWETE
jgi:hypothetical protein